MTLDDLIPPHVTSAVAELGLHKVAGAMLGVSELNLDVALQAIGQRAYMRRKEARAVADGIAAFATLTNVKVAENPAMAALLRKSVMPALAGAGIATVPHLLSRDPREHELSALLPSMAIGGLLGGAGGGLSALGGATKGPVGEELAANLLRPQGA
jgi:hypothetical protein